MQRLVSLIFLICHVGISSTAVAQMEEECYLDVSYAYGTNQFLPSLRTNSSLEYDQEKLYSDIWFRGGFQIAENVSFSGALELTDQPHELIGTKFSRPDYPLSTGRFQQSVLTYETDKLTIRFGRDDLLSTDLRPDIFSYPIFADGISWSYSWQSWNFEHVYQTLPAEEQSNKIFKRSVSYHHLSKIFNDFTFGAGEYFILTGEIIGLDLKRLNPFLPYSLNSHDSKADYYPGFSGDSDNSVIKLFLNWSKQSSNVAINLYIDEFQIDAADREVYSDALLLILSSENNIDVLGQNSLLTWGFSSANPNFGQHPGPFTTTTSANFPLFEYTPGMTHLAYLQANVSLSKRIECVLGGYTERWVNISQLLPSLMNVRTELDSLKVNSDSRLNLGLEYKLKNYPVNLEFEVWTGSNSGMRLIIQYESNRGIKP